MRNVPRPILGMLIPCVCKLSTLTSLRHPSDASDRSTKKRGVCALRYATARRDANTRLVIGNGGGGRHHPCHAFMSVLAHGVHHHAKAWLVLWRNPITVLACCKRLDRAKLGPETSEPEPAVGGCLLCRVE